MNTTVNGSSCSFLPSTARKIGGTIALCLFLVVSLVGNSFIGIIVYKTQTLRKPINYFIANMAMSDLLYPIFLIPLKLTWLYVDSWLISGPVDQVSCKLRAFLSAVSSIVSVQSLLLITIDRFGAVVFPLRSPLIRSKLCPNLHSRHLDHRSGRLLARFVRLQICSGIRCWQSHVMCAGVV